MIVCPHPIGRKVLNFINRFKEVLIKPIVTYGAAVDFDAVFCDSKICALDITSYPYYKVDNHPTKYAVNLTCLR